VLPQVKLLILTVIVEWWYLLRTMADLEIDRGKFNGLRLEFKSPVQSGFFAFFGRGLDWTAFGSLGMVHGPLKDWSKAVATGFQKDQSKTTKKPVQTTKKPVFFAFY